MGMARDDAMQAGSLAAGASCPSYAGASHPAARITPGRCPGYHGIDQPALTGRESTPGEGPQIMQELKHSAMEKLEIIVQGKQQEFVQDLLDRAGVSGWTVATTSRARPATAPTRAPLCVQRGRRARVP